MKKKRVAIFISGGGSNMSALLADMAKDHPAKPVLVFSNVPDAGGLRIAQDIGVPTAVLDHRPYGADRARFENELIRLLEPAKPDILCLAGFMRVLTAEFVARHEGRILNIHPSLLPAYRGTDTHRRALADGVSEHGCTVHLVTPLLDDGPILGRARVLVQPADTPETLAARVLSKEHVLYPAVLRRFAAGDETLVELQ